MGNVSLYEAFKRKAQEYVFLRNLARMTYDITFFAEKKRKKLH
jgi:hypothetical protein